MRTLPPTGVPITSTDIAQGLMASLGGPASTERFVAAFASRFGVKYCRAVGSGRAALSIALQALGQLSRRRGIVIPAYTSFSVPAAVVRAGFRVTLCDVDPATLDFDLDHLGSLVDDNTLAVMPNHLFGFPAALEPIAAIARGRGAFVVEDAAQAMGARYKGRLAGTLGDVGIYSLGRGKNITALDGGIVVTNSAAIAAALAQIAVEAAPRLPPLTDLAKASLLGVLIRPALFGWPERIPGLDLGVSKFEPEFPLKAFNAFRAGIAGAMLDKLDHFTAIRRTNAARYQARLDRDVAAPVEAVRHAEPCFLRLPVLASSASSRVRLVATLRAAGLGASAPYPACLADVPGLRPHLVGRPGPLTGARRVVDRLLTLPTHPLVTPADIDAICARITTETDQEAAGTPGQRVA